MPEMGCGATGATVGTEELQLIATVAEPEASPEAAVIVAVPLWLCGAVRTERTPLPLSVALAGASVPSVVESTTVAPAPAPVAVMKEALPQVTLLGAAETVMVVAPVQLIVIWAVPVTEPAVTVIVASVVVLVVGAVNVDVTVVPP
jgi:hypothetical protein